MKRLVMWMTMLAVTGGSWTFAGEHPEHPKKVEHPEHPKGTAQEHKIEMLKEAEAIKAYAKEIESVVKEYNLPVMSIDGKGVLVSKDTKLVKIHTDKIIRYKGDTYFACADFKDPKSNTMYDFDFFMTKTPTGWAMDKVLYHKRDGKLQCTYNEQCEPVPVK